MSELPQDALRTLTAQHLAESTTLRLTIYDYCWLRAIRDGGADGIDCLRVPAPVLYRLHMYHHIVMVCGLRTVWSRDNVPRGVGDHAVAR